MTGTDTWRRLAQALVGEPTLTGIEAAARAGIEIEQGRRLWRALGFPPVPDGERVFTQSDVVVMQGIRNLLADEGFDADVLLQLTRVTGQALARIAEAQVASNADLLASPGNLVSAAAVDLIAARVIATVPQIEPFLGYVWRRHLLAAILRLEACSGDPKSGARTIVVGFADLVGFTAISQQLSEHELAAMVGRFEALAYEHIPEHGGRVIKMIGDEVMFSIDGAPAGAELALALVEAFTGDATLPEVRAGLAIGPTLSWEGDLFGPTVNLASRLVNLARPGSVLVSDDMGRELEPLNRFELRHLRALLLKGIGRARSWVVRRKPAPASTADNRPTRRRRRRARDIA